MKFVKGHGTENDFVIFCFWPRDDIAIDFMVRKLCDRHSGVGADGAIRAVRAGQLLQEGQLTELPDRVGIDDWFMDYRNADGSVGEMCGNGVRVFAHFLRVHGLVDTDTFVIGSRAGAREVQINTWDNFFADITVAMGPVGVFGQGQAQIGGNSVTGLAIDVGNPHLACVVAGLSAQELDTWSIAELPDYDSELFPHGVNLEVITAPYVDATSKRIVHMRVHERGSGETRSCATGTVAAALAALLWEFPQDECTVGHSRDVVGSISGVVDVHVPGGVITVHIADRHAVVRGPSALVFEGEIAQSWWCNVTESTE